MGRKPNPLIQGYFERGSKLADSSNRYPHTCKLCGERFPKGRLDSLMSHITRRCPAMPEADRIHACLEFNGIAGRRLLAPQPFEGEPSLLQCSTPPHGSLYNSTNSDEYHHDLTPHRPDTQQHHGDDVRYPPHIAQRPAPRTPEPQPHSILEQGSPQTWSALEALAEASRQADMSDKQEGRAIEPDANPFTHHHTTSQLYGGQIEVPHTLSPVHTEPEVHTGALPENEQTSTGGRSAGGLAEDGLQPSPIDTPTLAEVTEFTDAVAAAAAAATARLNPSLLDPELSGPPFSPTTPDAAMMDEENLRTDDSASSMPHWERMVRIGDISAQPTPPLPPRRGGVRMSTSNDLHSRSRHSRAKFSPTRRREVQEIRKIGACIRCRILRKNCSTGLPCEACKKVLSPRVWRTGCVRTRLHEQLDLYSASVQFVLAQNRMKLLRSQLQLKNNGTMIELSHFPGTDRMLRLETLVAIVEPMPDGSPQPPYQVVMVDPEIEDLPEKVETYMRAVLPVLVGLEPSYFTRTTLEVATQQPPEEGDDLLLKALELWGLVEIIDRERQWVVTQEPNSEAALEGAARTAIHEADRDSDIDTYTMVCLQINAAAERKASSTCKSILNGMHRVLQDSKLKVGFRMFLTALVFLICVEKSTWAFKAWEQAHLRPGWPLERDPGSLAQQGSVIAGLIKMLLSIRKALPVTSSSLKGKLVAEGSEQFTAFFQKLDLDYDHVQARVENSQFSPADSRSMELVFSSHLLLP